MVSNLKTIIVSLTVAVTGSAQASDFRAVSPDTYQGKTRAVLACQFLTQENGSIDDGVIIAVQDRNTPVDGRDMIDDFGPSDLNNTPEVGFTLYLNETRRFNNIGNVFGEVSDIVQTTPIYKNVKGDRKGLNMDFPWADQPLQGLFYSPYDYHESRSLTYIPRGERITTVHLECEDPYLIAE